MTLLAPRAIVFAGRQGGGAIAKVATKRSSVSHHGRPRQSKFLVKADSSGDPGRSGQGSSSNKKSIKKSKLNDQGYHPSEDVPNESRKLRTNEGKLKLADIARTVAEVHDECSVFLNVSQGTPFVIGVNAAFTVHHDGEFFLELEDNWELIQNLQNDPKCSILIGFGDAESVSNLEENPEEAEITASEFESNSSDSDDDVDNPARPLTEEEIENFKAIHGNDWQEILEMMSPEGMGSLGAWGGRDSLLWVHPWDFSLKLSEAVSRDASRDMDFPARRLLVTGIVRKATDEEELRIRTMWNEKYAESDSDSEEEEGDKVGPGRVLLSELEDDSIAVELDLDGLMISGDHSSAKINPKSVEVGAVPKAMKSTPFAGRIMQGPGGTTYIEINGLDSFLPLQRDGLSAEESEMLLANTDVVDWVGSFPEGSKVLQVEAVLGEDGSISWQVSHLDGTPAAEEDSESVQSLHAYLENQYLGPGGTMDFTITEEGIRLGLGLDDDDDDDENDDSASTSLYKVEILTVDLDSTNGIREPVEVSKWCAGKPDMLAHSARAIIERANSLERARRCMADLVLREHGITVDEVFMVGIDHIGIDVRAKMGIELKTFRFPFMHPAYSERTAERLLDELLRPKQGQVRRTAKRSRQSKSKRVRGRLSRP